MTKKSLLLVVLLTVSLIVNSQVITIGLKGGVNNNTNVDIQGYGEGYTNDTFSANKDMGTQFGGFIDVSFGRFFIRPEVLFTSLKNTYDFPSKVANLSSTRMDIPILFGVHVYGPVSFVAGPVFSNVSKFELEGLDSYSDPVIYDETLLNLQAGILFEIGRFGLDVRYEYGLKTIEQQNRLDFNNGSAFDSGWGINLANLLEYNPSQLIISVHINLFRINSNDRKRMSRSDWRNHRYL